MPHLQEGLGSWIYGREDKFTEPYGNIDAGRGEVSMKRVKMEISDSCWEIEHLELMSALVLMAVEGVKSWDYNKLFNRQRTN